MFDKIEQYYAFHCDNPTEFVCLQAIWILTEMLQTGLYVQASSLVTVRGSFLTETTMDACWKVCVKPADITEQDMRAMF